MPVAAPSPCTEPGCPNLVGKGSRCPEHNPSRQRGSSTEQGYGHRWRVARIAFLAANPFCWCGELATVVDHITPHKGDAGLFWSRDNWQSLCKRHHDRKTAREDGRWG